MKFKLHFQAPGLSIDATGEIAPGIFLGQLGALIPSVEPTPIAAAPTAGLPSLEEAEEPTPKRQRRKLPRVNSIDATAKSSRMVRKVLIGDDPTPLHFKEAVDKLGVKSGTLSVALAPSSPYHRCGGHDVRWADGEFPANE